MSTRPPPSGLRRPQVLHACWRGRPWLLPLPRPSNRRVPRLKEPSPLRLRIQASPPLGLGLPPHSSTSRVFLPPLEAATASTEKEPRNPTPALVGLTQRAALGSPLCHPFRGKSGEEAAFQNRRTVHPGEWVGSCSSLLWTTPLHLPWERPRLLSRLVARYPPPPAVSRQPLSVTKEAPRLRPQCAGAGSVPAPPAPPPPRSCGLVLGLVVLPCLWLGRCRRPLWLHSRNHLRCRPPHPQPCSKRPLCLAFSQGLLTPPTPQPTTGAAFITRPPSPIRAPRATNRMMAAYTF